MVGANQSRVDFSPTNSVTTIVSLHLMALDVLHYRSDVWTPMPPNSIITWLAGCQGDRLVSLL